MPINSMPINSIITWHKPSERLPEFDNDGCANDLLFWVENSLYSGSCQNHGGNPVFIDWWIGGNNVDTPDLWAYWPDKPVYN